MSASTLRPSRPGRWLVPAVLAAVLAFGAGVWDGWPHTAPATASPAEVVLAGGASLSILVPDAPGPHPVLVHVPGGGWTSVDRSPVADAFGHDHALEQGWAVATVRYRSAEIPGVTASDQVDDVVAALDWLRRSGQDRDLDGPVVAMGHSAGAHLLALAADRQPLDALVLAAGVYDLADDVRRSPMLADGLSAAFACQPERCAPPPSLLPAVTAVPAAPVTMVHGAADRVTPAEGALRYAAALEAAGVPVELVLVDGGRHRGEHFDAAVRGALGDALAQARAERSNR